MVELEWDEGARQINDCEYLFVQSIREIEELTLEVVLIQAKPQTVMPTPHGDSPTEAILAGSRPIESDATCGVYRLIFSRRHMVSYSVLNESYGVPSEAGEKFTGKLLRIFSQSPVGIHKASNLRVRRVSRRPQALPDCLR